MKKRLVHFLIFVPMRPLLVEQEQQIVIVPCCRPVSSMLRHHQVNVIQHSIDVRVRLANNDVRQMFDECWLSSLKKKEEDEQESGE